MKEADTLFMIGTSFPHIDYLPRPGAAKGIQIDIKPEKIGLRNPVEVGLVATLKLYYQNCVPCSNKRRKNDDINNNNCRTTSS